MPKELFSTAMLKAMIPYADIHTAHSLDLLLQAEQMRSSLEQTIHTFHEFQETAATPPELNKEYELAANELGHSGNEMDLEGMIQAMQAVSSTEERKRLDQILMLIRVRKIFAVSHDSSLMFEALSSFMSPEQKKQLDELLPLVTMLQEGKTPL